MLWRVTDGWRQCGACQQGLQTLHLQIHTGPTLGHVNKQLTAKHMGFWRHIGWLRCACLNAAFLCSIMLSCKTVFPKYRDRLMCAAYHVCVRRALQISTYSLVLGYVIRSWSDIFLEQHFFSIKKVWQHCKVKWKLSQQEIWAAWPNNNDDKLYILRTYKEACATFTQTSGQHIFVTVVLVFWLIYLCVLLSGKYL